MIDGVKIKELKIIRDSRGQVMLMLRNDDELFSRFGEIYFSVVNPGVVKGWKKHQQMTQLFVVPQGNVRLVIFDDRTGSATKTQVDEIMIGEDDYKVVRIPPQVWYGFGCLGKLPAMIANCSDIPHDPQESEHMPLEDAHIPYNWRLTKC